MKKHKPIHNNSYRMFDVRSDLPSVDFWGYSHFITHKGDGTLVFTYKFRSPPGLPGLDLSDVAQAYRDQVGDAALKNIGILCGLQSLIRYGWHLA